jgi:hypothetical protein
LTAGLTGLAAGLIYGPSIGLSNGLLFGLVGGLIVGLQCVGYLDGVFPWRIVLQHRVIGNENVRWSHEHLFPGKSPRLGYLVPAEAVWWCVGEERIAAEQLPFSDAAGYALLRQPREAPDGNAAARVVVGKERHDPSIELVIGQRIEWVHQQSAYPREPSLGLRLFEQRVENWVEETLGFPSLCPSKR